MTEQSSSQELNFHVRTLESGQHSYSFPLTAKLLDLKKKVQQDTNISPTLQRILHRGRELTDDSQPLSSIANSSDGVILHLATRRPPGSESNARRVGGGGGGGAINIGPFVAGPGGAGAGGMGIPMGAIPIENFGELFGGNFVDQLRQAASMASGQAGGGGGGIIGSVTFGPDGQARFNSGANAPAAGAGRGNQQNRGRAAPGAAPGTRNVFEPQLDARGRYTHRSILAGIDDLLVRLQNGNMESDRYLHLFMAMPQSIRSGTSANAWSQAGLTFLRSARTILHNADLNRETLAAVNGVFTSAGLQGLRLGVGSHPIGNISDTDDASPLARDAEQESDSGPPLVDDDEDNNPPPELASDDDDEEDSEEEDDYYDSEEDEENYDDAYYNSDGGEEVWMTDEDLEEEYNEEDLHFQNTIVDAVANLARHGSVRQQREEEEEEEQEEDDASAMPNLTSDEDDGSTRRNGVNRDNDSMPELESEGEEEERAEERATNTAGLTTAQQIRLGMEQAMEELQRNAEAVGAEFPPRPSPALREEVLQNIPRIAEIVRQRHQVPQQPQQQQQQQAAAAAATAQRQQQQPQTQQQQQQGSAWLSRVSNDDLVLVLAVTVGELTRRFMGVLGQETAPVQTNAMIMRLADRLRSLSSLDGGRQEIIRQTRLITGHLMRVAATTAELGRMMGYLTSALEVNNMQFLQLNPGYIAYDNGRAVSNLSIATNDQFPNGIFAGGFFGGSVAGMGVPVPAAVVAEARIEVQAVPPPSNANAATGGLGPGATTRAARRSSSQQEQQQQQQTRAAPAAPPAPPAPSTNQQQQGHQPENNFASSVNNIFQALGTDIGQVFGQDRSESVQAALNQISGMTDALSGFLVSSVDVHALSNEIVGAVQENLGQQPIPTTETVRRIGSAVEEILRRNFAAMAESTRLQEFRGHVETVLGPEVYARYEELRRQVRGGSAVSQPAGEAATTTQEEAGLEALRPRVIRRTCPPSSTSVVPSSSTAAPAPPASNSAPPASAAPTPPPTQATPATASETKPKPAKGPSLPPRRGGPSLPARPTATRASTTTTNATNPPASTSATEQQPPSRPAAPAAGGAGGGLASMMRSLSSNPSMQQAAQSLLGGSGSGGSGGLDLGSLMQAAGPLMGQLVGGGGGGASTGAARQPTTSSTAAPADLATILASVLPTDEVEKWTSTIEADQVAQLKIDEKDDGFSEAYLSALPPKAASGLLGGLFGDE